MLQILDVTFSANWRRPIIDYEFFDLLNGASGNVPAGVFSVAAIDSTWVISLGQEND